LSAESAASDPAYRPVPASDIVAEEAGTKPGPTNGAWALIVPFLIGGAVSVALGAYGKLHDPSPVVVNLAGFSSPITVKVWLASVAVLFAIVQLVTALAMYGKLPGVSNAPAWTSTVHRWSGRIAFLLAIPVALHCLYALGFDGYTPRVLVHSLLGCFFFGAFTAKMLLLTRKGLPGWALPVFGGLVFTALAGLWLTSSLWFFTTHGVKF
jgi:hypothetical protein